MQIPYDIDGYRYITDNTTEIDSDTILLLTFQNKKYYEQMDRKPNTMTVDELTNVWGFGGLGCIGITGTNGKTTTAALIYSILTDLGEKCALQGTRGFFADDERIESRSMTTPSILSTLYNMRRAVERGCRYFVMEVSSHAIDQKRIEGIEFALKIHTNVTSDHLDYHKSIEEYRDVKSRFFADESVKLLNKDDIKNIKYNPKKLIQLWGRCASDIWGDSIYSQRWYHCGYQIF